MKKLLFFYLFNFVVYNGYSQGFFDYGHIIESNEAIPFSLYFETQTYSCNDTLCINSITIDGYGVHNDSTTIDSSQIRGNEELKKIITIRNLKDSRAQYQKLIEIVSQQLKTQSSTIEKLKDDKFRNDNLDKYLSIHSTLEQQRTQWNIIYSNLLEQEDEMNFFLIDSLQNSEIDQNRLKAKAAYYRAIKNKIDQLYSDLKNVIDECNGWNITLSEKIKNEEAKKSKAFFAQPEQLLSNNQAIPSIAVKGMAQTGEFWFNEVIYFTGTDGRENEKDYLNFLLPNYSKHGILVNGFIALDQSHSGIRYTANYQNKNYTDSLLTDGEKINLDFVQLGIGSELAFFNDQVAIYGMINFVRPLNNRDMFASLFQLDRNRSFHFDGGIKFNLLSSEANQKNGTKLQLNLNFLRLVGPFENEEIESEETLPSVKVSFSKTITK